MRHDHNYHNLLENDHNVLLHEGDHDLNSHELNQQSRHDLNSHELRQMQRHWSNEIRISIEMVNNGQNDMFNIFFTQFDPMTLIEIICSKFINLP